MVFPWSVTYTVYIIIILIKGALQEFTKREPTLLNIILLYWPNLCAENEEIEH